MIAFLLFWVCALAAIVGALFASAMRNLFHSALMLGLSLAGLAGIYVFLDAGYLACVQVVVYIGGILVLLLFATLFSADIMGQVQRTSPAFRAVGIFGAILCAIVAVRLTQVTVTHGVGLVPTHAEQGAPRDVIAGPHETLGDLLIGPWFVPFAAAGVLLTVALVGAAATVKRHRRPAGAPRV
ncbi:MAG: NADH-quinone oxidoreductase subunit J [Planctomycetota bacterium]